VKYGPNDIVPGKSETALLDTYRPAGERRDSRLHNRRQEFWIINSAHNLCHIHPAQVGIRRNLNLITASGHVYSFLLTEISTDPKAEADLTGEMNSGGEVGLKPHW
jgi:hypothetical protein